MQAFYEPKTVTKVESDSQNATNSTWKIKASFQPNKNSQMSHSYARDQEQI